MRGILFCTIALVLSIQMAAQSTITIKPQHSKKVVYSFKNDEELYADEARLFARIDGGECEFVTTRGQRKYYAHKGSKTYGPFSWGHYYENTFSVDRTDDGLWMLNDFARRKKYGPFKRITVDGTMYGKTKRKLYGYCYQSDSLMYVQDMRNGKRHGPFRHAVLHRATKSEFYFTYELNNQHFISLNGQVQGPFHNIVARYPRDEAQAFYYSIQKNVNGDYYAYVGDKTFGPFHKSPGVTGSLNNLVVKAYATNNKPAVIELNSGERFLQGSGAGKFTRFEDGSWLYGQYLFDDSTLSYEQKVDIRRKEPIPIRLSSSNGVIGLFYCMNDDYWPRKGSATSYVMEVREYQPNLTAEQIADLPKKILYNGQLIEPICNIKRWTLSNNLNCFAYVDTESGELIIDNQRTGILNTKSYDISNYPKNWIVRTHADGVGKVYKNGKLLLDQQSDGFPHIEFIGRTGRWYSTYRLNRETYVVSSNNNRPIGPLRLSRRQQITPSDNGRHLAIPSVDAVYVDGKIIDRGFSVIYNKHLNAFMWLSVDDNQLIMHTYELD